MCTLLQPGTCLCFAPRLQERCALDSFTNIELGMQKLNWHSKIQGWDFKTPSCPFFNSSNSSCPEKIDSFVNRISWFCICVMSSAFILFFFFFKVLNLGFILYDVCLCFSCIIDFVVPVTAWEFQELCWLSFLPGFGNQSKWTGKVILFVCLS